MLQLHPLLFSGQNLKRHFFLMRSNQSGLVEIIPLNLNHHIILVVSTEIIAPIVTARRVLGWIGDNGVTVVVVVVVVAVAVVAENGGERNSGSTERAVGGVLKPNIDAIDVKRMATIRNHSKLLTVFELTQTHRAFIRFNLRFLIFSLLLRELPELDHRNRPNDGLLEAVLGDFTGLIRGGARVPAAAAVPVQAALDDEDVVADEQEGGGENADDGDHHHRKAPKERRR